MRITKESPPAPPVEYVLRMSYPELHELSRELSPLPLDGCVKRPALLRLRDLLRHEDYQRPTDGCDA